MKKIFTIISILLLASSCSHLTVRDKNKAETEANTPEEIEKKARLFVQNAAALQYIDYATVVKDTAYIGIPSRRGKEHTYDNLAKTFLTDVRKSGNFTNIVSCIIVNTASKGIIWSDTLVSGQVIGYADMGN